MTFIPSASQTVGPFFNFALTADPSLGALAGPGAEGEPIQLRIRVLDGNGDPAATDALIELWQADSQGRYDQTDPNFCGFGRLETDDSGTCTFQTVKPGPVEGQAPHINVAVFARGLLKQLHTRIYFADEPSNHSDPILALVPDHRRGTLLAHRDGNQWSIDIRLQGEGETVFFDV
jgi:protocatechuate 3,4-dioxygenase alpha subunit